MADAESVEESRHRLIEEWNRKGAMEADPLTRAVYAALARVATSVYRRHGRLIGSKSIIENLCLTLVGNGFGSEMIGHLIEP